MAASSTGKSDTTRHPKKRAFLATFRLTGNVTIACQEVGVHRSTIYDWREQDPAFVLAMEQARVEASDLLEEEARRRAVVGTEEPVFGRVGRDQDGEIGAIRRYSDSLLIFLLKGNRPDKFRERIEHSGQVRHDVSVQPDLSKLSAEDLTRLKTIAGKLAAGGSDPGAA